MTAYLIDHPPRIRQFRPRGRDPSGVVLVHTAESFADETGPDTGAENVARFIQQRTNYGSYHDLVDSDSILDVVPGHLAAYGDGTGSNSHAFHISFACSAAEWPRMTKRWKDAAIRNAAKSAARYARWMKRAHGIEIPARKITRAQSEDEVPGFLGHGDRDPDRRTDPGDAFPWDQFLAEYERQLHPKRKGTATGSSKAKRPTRGKLVDEALSDLSALITLLDGTLAEEGSRRETLLVQVEDGLRAERRRLRMVGIINAEKAGQK